MTNVSGRIGALRDPFVWTALSLMIAVIVCVMWIFVVVSRRIPEDSADPFVLAYFAARLMQLTLGMLIGLVLTVLGVIMAWFGITQDVDVDVEAVSMKAKLVSASPGALLVLCGTIIIVYSMSLKLEVKASHSTGQVNGTYEQPK